MDTNNKPKKKKKKKIIQYISKRIDDLIYDKKKRNAEFHQISIARQKRLH